MNMRRIGFPQINFAPVEGGGAASSSGGTSASTEAASTPSPSPSGASADTSAAATPSASDDLMNLGNVDDFEELSLPSAEGGVGAAAEGTGTPPPKEPAAEGAQPPPPPAPKKEEVAATSTVPPGQKEGTPPAPPAGPQKSFLEQVEEHRDVMIDTLAKERFALTKEQADALELDVIGSVPKLLARTYYEAMASVHKLLESRIPEMVSQQLKVSQEHEAAVTAFYGKHTALDRTKHHNDVLTFAKALRATNPQMPNDELLALAAASVMARHGLTAPAAAPSTNGSAPLRPNATPAFVPARPGTVVRSSPEKENPFEGMGREYEDDEA